MYIPGQYRQSDQEEIQRLIRNYPFATVITWDESGPFANHLPILLSDTGSKLIGHLVRANPQARHFEEGHETLVIFNGPHAYISPRWYRAKEHVPTWNYATVHVRGKSRAVPADFQQKLMKALVGFEIEMTQVDAKFKLGQNRGDEMSRGVLELMLQQKKTRKL